MNSAYRNSKLALLAGAALFSLGAWAMPSLADSVSTRTEIVKYRPADAATQEGAAQLYGKLRVAATIACRHPHPRSFDDRLALAACVGEALDKAVQDLSLPMVAALHQGVESPTENAVASR